MTNARIEIIGPSELPKMRLTDYKNYVERIKSHCEHLSRKTAKHADLQKRWREECPEAATFREMLETLGIDLDQALADTQGD